MHDHEMTSAPMQRQDLDAKECQNPACPGGHPFFIIPPCHPGNGVNAGYVRETGCLNIYCNACRRLLCRVQVAEATIQ